MLCCIVLQIAVTALRTEAIVRSNSFQQRGLTRAILSSKETDARVKRDIGKRSDRRNGKRIRSPVFNSIAEESERFQHDAGWRIPHPPLTPKKGPGFPPFPFRENKKYLFSKSGVSFATQNTPPTNHLPPANHHNLTTKKPQNDTQFFRNPL